MKFIVTSQNRKKVEAVEKVLLSIFGTHDDFVVEGYNAPSGVSDQPLTLEETKRGAINRIFNCPCQAEFYVSIESGVEREFDTFYSFTFAAVCDATQEPRVFGFGTSTRFPVPDYVAAGLEAGKTLGEINHSSEGLIANVTNNKMKRTDLIAEAVAVALCPIGFYPTIIPENVPKYLMRFQEDMYFIEWNQLTSQFLQLDFDLKESAGTDVPSFVPSVTPESSEVELKDVVHVLLWRPEYDMSVLGKLLHENTYIMTPRQHHSAIAAYLIKNQHFGFKNITLIKQTYLPVRNSQNECVLKSQSEVMTAFAGDGSILETLKKSGAIKAMRATSTKRVLVQTTAEFNPSLLNKMKTHAIVKCGGMYCFTMDAFDAASNVELEYYTRTQTATVIGDELEETKEVEVTVFEKHLDTVKLTEKV